MTDIDYKHPPEAFLRSVDIHSLLPQQEPFVMVDFLTGFDGRETVTETLVRKDNVFVENGRFTPAGLVENIAQTCAARIGYVNKYIMKKGIEIGFIGAIRNMSISATPAVGDTIVTRMEVTEEVFGVILARAEVTCGGRSLATTEMKIAMAKKEE